MARTASSAHKDITVSSKWKYSLPRNHAKMRDPHIKNVKLSIESRINLEYVLEYLGGRPGDIL